MYSLTDKIIWLTGASQGIGAALCRELVSRGAKVAITARSKDLLYQIENELTPQVRAFPGDVTDLAQMKNISEEIESTLGPINMMIANAGSCFYINDDSFSSEACLSLMDLNYGGVLRCIEAVLPKMTERKDGVIVGVASLAGYRGLPRASAYGATKAGLIHFLESFRFQLARQGVAVTVVNPGFVKTPLTDKNNFPMPFLITPERAAKYICDGLERQKKEIAFPFGFTLFMKLMNFLPHCIYEKLVMFVWKKLNYV